MTRACKASLVTQTVKNLPARQETQAQSLGQEDPLEKGMATHSSVLAWKIPWTEELGRLQSMVCKESDMTEQLTLSLFIFFHAIVCSIKNTNILSRKHLS